MADRYWGSIAFGGQIKKDLIPKFIEALEEDISEYDKGDFTSDLAACEKGPSQIEYSDCDARYGEFETVQDFCRKHGIHYLVKSSAYAEYDAQVKFYDGNEETEVLTDSDFDPSISRYHLKRYMALAKEYCADPSKVPLKLESKYYHEKRVAKTIAKSGSFDPLTIFEALVDEILPDINQVMELHVID